ncbi:hypothetical protein EDC94DRAFT_255716 [Helicostylum pulchrum]|nr:hypothetical protein EDC94DRAFT_255716 [Helicostylum pulchrum]
MYANNQQQPMYGGMPSTSYHWDHQLRVSSHDRVTVSSHHNDSHWYSDSVLCQSAPTVSSQHMKSDSSASSSSNGSPISNKSLSSQQHALLFSPTQGSGPRAVIPSKRAAQNRAAQRAFRQRKERYVKDLEKKAKLMDEWKTELDQLRQQNKELRETTMRLEKQIHQQQQYNSGDKLISPITSPAMSVEIVPAPVVVVMENQKTTRRKIKQEESPHKIQTSFLPVNLRAPDQTGYGSPTTSCSSSSSIGGLEDQTNYGNQQLAWPTTSGTDFDPYETNLDFISNGGQVLDDLCAVLQTRQRPEINSSYATMQNQQQQNYVMSLNSPVVRSDTNTMLMSRTY